MVQGEADAVTTLYAPEGLGAWATLELFKKGNLGADQQGNVMRDKN